MMNNRRVAQFFFFFDEEVRATVFPFQRQVAFLP